MLNVYDEVTNERIMQLLIPSFLFEVPFFFNVTHDFKQRASKDA